MKRYLDLICDALLLVVAMLLIAACSTSLHSSRSSNELLAVKEKDLCMDSATAQSLFFHNLNLDLDSFELFVIPPFWMNDSSRNLPPRNFPNLLDSVPSSKPAPAGLILRAKHARVSSQTSGNTTKSHQKVEDRDVSEDKHTEVKEVEEEQKVSAAKPPNLTFVIFLISLILAISTLIYIFIKRYF